MAKTKGTGGSFFVGMESFETETAPAAPAVPAVPEETVRPVNAPEQKELSSFPSAGERKRRERLTARMNLLVTPSLFDAVKAIAARDDMSMNEIANEALAKYVQEHS